MDDARKIPHERVDSFEERLKKLEDEAAKRTAFLKDKSPMEILLWMMRSGNCDPRIQADIGIALLPYHHPKVRSVPDE
jgi:hypothetical protein